MLGIPFIESAFFKLFKTSSEGDRTDRLNSTITSCLLLFFAILVSAKQYVGSPIQCWMPMEFRGGWEQYVEDYCFIQNTYWVHFDDPVPRDIDDRKDAEIGYYQWVPIVLAIQAFMFFIPSFIWNSFHNYTGLELDSVIQEAREVSSVRSKDERKEEISKLAVFVENNLELHTSHQNYRIFCFNFGRSLGSYASTLYLIIKLLYTVNIIAQFIILNNFLGANYHLWGFQTLKDLWDGRVWLDSGVFPRVTMCDFKVRRLANIHRYSVQCVLMINMFNEKIYLFIWFWFFFVAIATIVNFFYNLITMLVASRRESRVGVLLKKASDGRQNVDENILRRFVHKALKPDGVLLLRLVDLKAGNVAARELCYQLFVDYCKYIGERYVPTLKTVGGKNVMDDGFTEGQYNAEKTSVPFLQPDLGYSSLSKPKDM